MFTVDIKELKKSMYPNCIRDGTVFDYTLNRTVKLNDTNYVCYMSYYLHDNHYSAICFQTLQELTEFEFHALFIFRVICDKEIFDNLISDGDGYYEGMMTMLGTCWDGIINSGTQYLDMLTVDVFPDIDISKKLNKSQMNEKTKEYYYDPHFKRDLYWGIMSTICYESDYSWLDDVTEYPHMIYVRIIGYKVDGFMKFEFDVNSRKESYDYDDYDVWLYAIPASNIPVTEVVNLLFLKFLEKV